MATRITTVRLGTHLPLLELLPDFDTPLAWVRNGEGLVGWGVFASKKVSGPKRFEQARQWWHQQLDDFEIENELHGPGTGPILFTSFSFDENEESELIIPKVIVGVRNQSTWITWIGDIPQPKLAERNQLGELPKVNWLDSDITSWKKKVNEAVKFIQSDSLDKVVLARELIAHSDAPIDARIVLRNLAKDYPGTWVYSNNGLVGATPELLVRLNNSMVVSRILAGTISKTGDDNKDLALAASLARSSKDLEEHEYAVRSVADALEPFCKSTNVPEAPFVLHLSNVMHLATDVTGAIKEGHKVTDIFTLLQKLHPSAAVCGTPTQGAAKLIRELEGINRRRYAGPIGWIDAKGDGEQGIALRCGYITGNEIHAFAGCGIVAGSDADHEVAESQAKFLPIINALR
ncbi:MAG: isochorismate synthase MenF [Candidatus Nanopelagicaceae bacterium]